MRQSTEKYQRKNRRELLKRMRGSERREKAKPRGATLGPTEVVTKEQEQKSIDNNVLIWHQYVMYAYHLNSNNQSQTSPLEIA